MISYTCLNRGQSPLSDGEGYEMNVDYWQIIRWRL